METTKRARMMGTITQRRVGGTAMHDGRVTHVLPLHRKCIPFKSANLVCAFRRWNLINLECNTANCG